MMIRPIGVFVVLLSGLPAAAGEFTTYIGDSYPYPAVLQNSVSKVRVMAMTTDAAGNTYLAGSRIPGGVQESSTPDADPFVTKLDADGEIVFTRVFGGNWPTEARAVAVDPSGNIYVAGDTKAPNLLLSNALQTEVGDCFLVKLSGDGRTVLYSTYFGGRTSGGQRTSVSAIATDAAGDLYLTGWTWSDGFPTTGELEPGTGLNLYTIGAFVTKISAAGDRIVHSGILAGTRTPCPTEQHCGTLVARTEGADIAVDGSGNAYVAGNTSTTDLPVTGGVFATEGIGAFVAKIASGGTLAYLTYVGMVPPSNRVNAIAVDGGGHAYFAGATDDDAFVAKVSADGSELVWASYLGGALAGEAQSVAVEADGRVWVSGSSGGGDFLAEVNAADGALGYSSGYANGTVGLAVGVDGAGLVHAAGRAGIAVALDLTRPPGVLVFGVTNAAGGETTGQVSRGEIVSIYGTKLGPAEGVAAALVNGALPTMLGGVQVLVGGQAAPLLYVSETQINAIVLWSDGAELRVVNGAGTSPEFRLVFVGESPQVFRDGQGYAAAINEDGTVNSAQHPAKRGSVVAIWATGAEEFGPGAALGSIVTQASNSCQQCQVYVYGSEVPGPGQHAEVLYAGAAPGLVRGATQVNFRMPGGEGAFLFRLQAGGYASEPVRLYVTSQ